MMDHLSAVDDLRKARAVPMEGDASSWTCVGVKVQPSTPAHLHLRGFFPKAVASSDPGTPGTNLTAYTHKDWSDHVASLDEFVTLHEAS